MAKRLWTIRVGREENLLNSYGTQQVPVQNPMIFRSDGQVSQDMKDKLRCVKTGDFFFCQKYEAEKYQKISKHPGSSPAHQTIQKSFLSSNKWIKEFGDAGAPENQWGEPAENARSDINCHIQCTLPNTSHWEKENLWGLCPVSFFLSSFPWG